MVATSNRNVHPASPGSRPALRYLRGRGPRRDQERKQIPAGANDRRTASPETESQLQHVFAREEEARSRAEALAAGSATAQPGMMAPEHAAHAARHERQPKAEAGSNRDPAAAAGTGNHGGGKQNERC
jgi:hypothetical protein